MSKQPEMPKMIFYDGSDAFDAPRHKYVTPYIRADLYDQLEREAQQLADALAKMEKHFGIRVDEEAQALWHPECIKASKSAKKALKSWNARKDKTT